jgi:hypothetical protein
MSFCLEGEAVEYMLQGFCIPGIEEQQQKINLVYKTQGKSEALASALEILGHW